MLSSLSITYCITSHINVPYRITLTYGNNNITNWLTHNLSFAGKHDQ
jgi:hypothetical protein